jgi:hypothetical protein
MRQNHIIMEVDEFPIDIPCLSQSAFMLEAHFLKAPPGGDIASLNHSIDLMQVIDSQCQSGKLFDGYPLKAGHLLTSMT